jgi:hypothetical protein
VIYRSINDDMKELWTIRGKQGESIVLKPLKGPGHTEDSIGFIMNVQVDPAAAANGSTATAAAALSSLSISSSSSSPSPSSSSSSSTSSPSSSPFHNSPKEYSSKRNLRILFCGDTMLGEGTSVYSDPIPYVSTLRRMSLLPIDVIYPGHGPVLDNPRLAIQDYIELIQFKEKKILMIIQEHCKMRKQSMPEFGTGTGAAAAAGSNGNPAVAAFGAARPVPGRSSFSLGLSPTMSSAAPASPSPAPTAAAAASPLSPSSISSLGISLPEIARKFYVRISSDVLDYATEMIGLHVNLLEKAGKIRKTQRKVGDNGDEENVWYTL